MQVMGFSGVFVSLHLYSDMSQIFSIVFTICDINVKRGRGLRAPRTPSRRAPPMHWGAVLWPQRQSICTHRRACMRRRCADLLQRQVLMSRTFKVLLQRSDEGEHEGSDLQRGVFPVSGKRCLRQVSSSNSTLASCKCLVFDPS